MQQNSSISCSSAQALVFHSIHPVSQLDFRIKNRLLDLFYDEEFERRKISSKALIKLIELNPIHVVDMGKKYQVISGWSKAYSAKLFNIVEEVPCLVWKNISNQQIQEMSYLDFFTDSSLLCVDDVARRIRSICLYDRRGDSVIRSILGDKLDPRKYYGLPAIRTKKALKNKLSIEEVIVQQFIREHFEKHLFNK
jgi:hypothetical protein